MGGTEGCFILSSWKIKLVTTRRFTRLPQNGYVQEEFFKYQYSSRSMYLSTIFMLKFSDLWDTYSSSFIEMDHSTFENLLSTTYKDPLIPKRLTWVLGTWKYQGPITVVQIQLSPVVCTSQVAPNQMTSVEEIYRELSRRKEKLKTRSEGSGYPTSRLVSSTLDTFRGRQDPPTTPHPGRNIRWLNKGKRLSGGVRSVQWTDGWHYDEGRRGGWS